ncbi:MAG: hypothetical protein U0105_25865 [Candidatus Obscuribacterales bacterium]
MNGGMPCFERLATHHVRPPLRAGRAAEKEWNEANPEDPLRAIKETFNIPTDPSQRLTGLDLEWALHKMDRGHLHPETLNPDAPNQDEPDSPNPDALLRERQLMGGAQKVMFLTQLPTQDRGGAGCLRVGIVPKAYRNAKITLFPLANSYHGWW